MLTVLNGSQPRGAGFLMSRVHVTSEQLAGRDDLKMKRVKSLILHRAYSEVASHPEFSFNLVGLRKKIRPGTLVAVKQEAVLKHLVNQTVTGLNPLAQFHQCHHDWLHDSIGMSISCHPPS